MTGSNTNETVTQNLEAEYGWSLSTARKAYR